MSAIGFACSAGCAWKRNFKGKQLKAPFLLVPFVAVVACVVIMFSPIRQESCCDGNETETDIHQISQGVYYASCVVLMW